MAQIPKPSHVLSICLIFFCFVPSIAVSQTQVSPRAAAEISSTTQPVLQAATCQGSSGYAASFGGRRTFMWRPEWMVQIKSSTTRDAQEVRQDIMSRARTALRHGPYSVTHKSIAPASGNKHDYSSIGPYWWPDAARPNGLPYVRRDGQANPERNGDGFDAARLNALSNDVSILARAYFLIDDRVYADKAAGLVRTWFLDPATRMNPSLSYAQAIPGVTAGRPEGIIDGHRFIPIIESIGLLTPSGALSQGETESLKSWFGDLSTWMITSEMGRSERAKNNNHGIYFDLLASHYALFAGNEALAREIIAAFPQTRIATQFAPDGRLPEELSRTRSWHYMNWTLVATSKLAGLGECVDVDLWTSSAPNGASLRRSLSWLAQYVARENTWPFPESAFAPGGDKRGSHRVALENLRLAAWGLRDPDLEALANYYGKLQPTAEEHRWLPPLLQSKPR